MANEEHLKLARQGRDAWNKWRAENPNEPADFSGTDFTLPENKNISFAGFEFGDKATFENAAFNRFVHFENARLGDHANFKTAKFGGGASFGDATFADWVNFADVKFNGPADFSDTKFGYVANFTKAEFSGAAMFTTAMFDGRVDYIGATFRDEARFVRATFTRDAYFMAVCFDQPPDFSGTNGLEYLRFVDTRFRFGRGAFRWTTEPKTVVDLRYLRSIAVETHATDAERDLFILERMAERGVLWKNWWDSWGRDKQKNWWKGNWGARLIGWWHPAAVTVLLFLYWALSNCGRSVAWPVVWFAVFNFLGFFNVYRSLAQKPHCCDAYSCLTFSGVLSLTEWPLISNPVCDSVLSFTLANLIPFGEMNKTMLEKSTVALFEKDTIPLMVHFATLAQGATNALLVFLLALALRNHFKVK